MMKFKKVVLCLKLLKNKEDRTKGLKMNFSNYWLMVRFNLSSDKVRNCGKTTTFMKEYEKIIKCKKKGTLNLVYKQGLFFEKFKESDKFKENDVSKTSKSVTKVSKTQSGNKFK